MHLMKCALEGAPYDMIPYWEIYGFYGYNMKHPMT